MSSPLKLFERLEQIRLSASILFDSARLKGMPKERIQENLHPLQRAYDEEISNAARTDLPGCVLAAESYEQRANAHEAVAQFSLEKAENARECAKKIRNALAKRLQDEGRESIQDGDFLVTRSRGSDGADSVTLR